MNKIMCSLFVITLGLFFVPSVHAEVVGAYVSKIITEYTDPGYASAAILVCAGNDPLSYPQIMIISDMETESIVIAGDVPSHTCEGETVRIQANDLGSITAELKSSTGLVAMDDPIRDSDGVAMSQGMSVDGKVIVSTSSTHPVSGQTSTIKVEFLDTFRNAIQDVNYDILIKQDGMTVLDVSRAYSNNGLNYHETDTLISDSSLEIEITILGIGMPDQESPWTGPQGKVIGFKAIPEFGTFTAMILVIAIISIIAITGKFGLSIMPKSFRTR